MTAGAYFLEPVETLTPAAMTRLRQIYEEGFPPFERAEFGSITTARREDELALALVSDGQPAGFALLRPLGSTGWIYLRYLVVDGARRSQGLGGQLWEQLTERFRDAGYTLLVFDVEDPDEPGCEPAQVELRWRRIRFYQRQGASLLPVTGYCSPEIVPGTSGWFPMLLMTAPLAGHPGAPDPGGAGAIVDAVYRFRWDLEPGQFPGISVHPGDPAENPGPLT
jgi:GNAT superfamily N-acetyltransferase